MGFQHMPEVVRRAAQRKGGKIRTDKGLAKLSPEKVREITSLGGKAKHANYNSRKGAKQTQDSEGRSLPELADVLTDIGSVITNQNDLLGDINEQLSE